MTNTDPSEVFDRYMWIQDFAARIAELGAPGPIRLLLELGAEQYEKSGDLNPMIAAERVGEDWPTQSATRPNHASAENPYLHDL